MKTIVVSISTGYVGSRKECEFEVEDDATEEQINEMALEAMWDMLDYSWYEKDEK